MKKSLGAKTIVYPTPVFVVGSYDKDGKPNVMTASWGGISCSKPPCISVSLRAATYSHANLKERKAFTVSIPSQDHIKAADYFGIASGRDTDKLAKAGLTAVKSGVVDAPYVKEFPLVLECAVVQVVELGLHTLFVGEVKDVKIDEEALNEKGVPSIEKIKPLIFAPESRDYFAVGGLLAKAFSVGKEL